MALDPVIAGGFRGLQLQDPLEQYSRISQIQQAQQQNALNALKMQEYQREMETENRLRALYARPDVNIRSPEFQREVFSVSPTRGAAMQKSAFEAQKEQRLADAAMEELAAKRIANARATLPAVTPETWGAWRADTIKKLPGLANMIPEAYSDDAKMQLMQTADQYITGRKPMVVAPGASVFQPGATTPMFTAPVAPAKPTPAETEEIVLRLQDPNLPPASRKALQDRLRILTTREPKEPKEPSAPIAVVDEATGKVKYVSREEAIGKTPPSAMEGLAPKEIQRREAVFPQAKQSVATVTSTMTEVENTIDRLLKNPKGLNGITGLVYGRTPALTDDARRAESDIKQLRNLAFVQGLTELRAASKTGAGVGNVSNKEGDRFENLKASLETTQSFDDMVAALKRLKAQTSATKTNLQTEFEDMYSYRQGRQSAPAPAPAPAPTGFPAPPQGAIDALKRGQGTDAQFDAIFGPGAAARARRQ